MLHTCIQTGEMKACILSGGMQLQLTNAQPDTVKCPISLI